MRYDYNFKITTVKRLLRPDSIGVPKLSEETGISDQTLYNWLNKYSAAIMKSTENRSSKDWSLLEKQEALVTAAGKSESELGAWQREAGIHSENLQLWAIEVREALGNNRPKHNKETNKARKKIQSLEKELRKKDKALAEVTALLVLKKKLESLFEDEV